MSDDIREAPEGDVMSSLDPDCLSGASVIESFLHTCGAPLGHHLGMLKYLQSTVYYGRGQCVPHKKSRAEGLCGQAAMRPDIFSMLVRLSP